MGLSLNEEEIRTNMAVVPGAPVQGVCMNFELHKIILYT